MSANTIPKPSGRVKHLVRPFEVKSVGEDDGTFEGYASVFGELDWYRDIVVRGAFKQSLEEDFLAKNRLVPMLWQHKSDNPIGVYPVLREDSIGLYVKGACNMEVQRGRECHALMKQGALTGLSIGYITEISEWNENEETRTLKQVRLYEISPVTFPASDSARASAKSIIQLKTVRDVENYLREEGFSRSEAEALVAIARKSGTVQGEPADGGHNASVKRALEILRAQ